MSTDGRDGSPPSTLVLGPAESMLREAVRNTVAAICERFANGSTMTLGSESGDQPHRDAIPWDARDLDEALGTGGLPLGRIVEIYGPESSGTMTLALRLIAAAQRHGLVCAFIDADHALDMEVARSLGVDSNELLVSQPDIGEQAIELAISLAGTGAVRLIVVGSVATLIRRAAFVEGELGECHIGLRARLISQAMRKLSNVAAQTNTLIVFISQLTGESSGGPEAAIVSSVVRYYTSMRLDISRIAVLADSEAETKIEGEDE